MSNGAKPGGAGGYGTAPKDSAGRGPYPPVSICLVRHGETAWNAEGRVQGQTDVPLNDVGRAQARAVAETLAGERFDAIYSSDLMRVTQTAAPLAARLGLEVQLDADLRERHYGMFERLTYVECKARFPEAYARFRDKALDFDFGSGESLQVFNDRSLACLHRIAARHAGGAVLVFTHGGVLEVLYRAAKDIGLQSVRDFEIPNAAINRFRYADAGWALLQWAETGHLETALDDLRD